MRKIYLVKKNPELPADGNNWLVMNSFEFRNFIQTPERMFGGNAVPAAMNGKPSSKHGSKAVCVLFVLREPFCKAIMILEQLILTYSQNGTMKRTPSGHRAMYRETR